MTRQKGRWRKAWCDVVKKVMKSFGKRMHRLQTSGAQKIRELPANRDEAEKGE